MLLLLCSKLVVLWYQRLLNSVATAGPGVLLIVEEWLLLLLLWRRSVVGRIATGAAVVVVGREVRLYAALPLRLPNSVDVGCLWYRRRLGSRQPRRLPPPLELPGLLLLLAVDSIARIESAVASHVANFSALRAFIGKPRWRPARTGRVSHMSAATTTVYCAHRCSRRNRPLGLDPHCISAWVGWSAGDETILDCALTHIRGGVGSRGSGRRLPLLLRLLVIAPLASLASLVSPVKATLVVDSSLVACPSLVRSAPSLLLLESGIPPLRTTTASTVEACVAATA